MTLKKRSTGAYDGAAARSVGLGAAYGIVKRVRLSASADTSVSLAITDRDGRTIATVASGNFTVTASDKAISAPTADVADTLGAAIAAAATEGVVARSPLTVTPAGVASGTVTVDVYVEV